MFEWGEISSKQLKSIDESTARINIWQGAVRSGKTIASIIRWLEYIKSGPKGELLMVGKTHRTLKRNILDVVQEIVGQENYQYNRGLGEVTIYGRKIYIAGANDARAEDKIRGMTLAGAYGDEVTIWPEGFFNMLLSRLSVKDAKLFCTTNPEGPYHWLKQDYINRADELDLKDFHFLLDDNLTLDHKYINNLKKEYSGVWYQRYILGKWVLAEGIIYDMVNDDNYISVNDLPKMKRHWIAADYGIANPTAFGLMGLGVDDKLYLIDEYWHSGREGTEKTDSKYADELENFIAKNAVKPDWIFIDPSAKSFITELYYRRNDNPAFFNIAKANNAVIDGIRRVGNLFGKNKLIVVEENCPKTKEELNSYVWDSKAQKHGEDKPLKENDHIMDLLRYNINGIPRTVERITHN